MYIGPSQSQLERRARSPLVEVSVLNEGLNLIDENDGMSEGDGYEIQKSSDLKRKRSEERKDSNDDDDGNKDVNNSTPKKKTSIQEKLKAFEAPSPTPTQKFKFRKLN